MALRLLIAILILAVPLELPGCGPFLRAALFYTPTRPEAPREFARGRLGIVQPAYERLYLAIAYRHLSGVGLSDAEAQAISPWPHDAAMGPGPGPGPEPGAPANPWLAARNRTPGIEP